MRRRVPARLAPTAARVAAPLLLAAGSLAAASLAACSVFDLAPGPGLNLDWDVVGAGELAPDVEAAASRASIVVSGRIPASLPCAPLKGDLEDSGSNLRLIVTVIEEQNFCVGSASTFRYVANLFNLEAGDRTLIVEHRFQNTDRPAEIVFEGTLSVG